MLPKCLLCSYKPPQEVYLSSRVLLSLILTCGRIEKRIHPQYNNPLLTVRVGQGYWLILRWLDLEGGLGF